MPEKIKNSEISKGIKIIDLCLFIEKEKTLVFSDTHLGFEQLQNHEGNLLPRFNLSKIKKRLENVFSKVKAEKIVICGDFKHEFGNLPVTEWNEAWEFITFLQSHCSEIVIIKGNHDKILGPINFMRKVKVEKEFLFLEKEKIFLCHGDKIFETKEFDNAKTIIIGHQHPAITLRDAAKHETFKCFIKGKFENKNLIVLPSVCESSFGLNVLEKKIVSPFLEQDLGNFETWIVEDKAYYFGKLKELE